jgi:hypothetical protein
MTTLLTTLFFSLLIGQKQWREKKGRERITTSCEYERESCPKVVKKWLSKYHFSISNGAKETK